MADVFISYKREEKPSARLLAEKLGASGYSVWWDDRLDSSESWDETIEREITEARAVIVLWSPLSVSSEWVRTEAHFANGRKKLVPLVIRPCTIPLAFTLIQAIDLCGWTGGDDSSAWRKALTWISDLVTARARRTEAAAAGARAPAREQVGTLPGGEPIVAGVTVGFQTPPGTLFRDSPETPVMRVVPAGRFRMGSPETEPGRREVEGPQHGVTIPEAFAIGVYPVTFAEWDTVALRRLDHKPSDHGWGRDARPVVDVSWFDARTYAEALSAMTGAHYRLPSEAEWEYAARAGSVLALPAERERMALHFCIGREAGPTEPVGFSPPNAFGLFDMAGNVREWCEDMWHINYAGAPGDGAAWTTGDGSMRVVRGGSWADGVVSARMASRARATSAQRAPTIGMRLVRDLA